MNGNGGGSLLGDERLAALLETVRGSDSIELKLTVPADHHRSTIDALQIDPITAQIRQVFFLDTPDLRLNAAGVVARARRVQGKTADTVLKLRPVVPGELSQDLRRSPAFNVEVDAMPGGYVCSGSLKGVTTNERVRSGVLGEMPVRKLFTKEQRAFYKDVAPEGIALDDLTLMGPIFVLKTKWIPIGTARPMVAEVWLYPDGSRVLELSTKCLPGEGIRVAAEAKAYLSSKGIDMMGAQETKTKKALEFFTAAATPIPLAA